MLLFFPGFRWAAKEAFDMMNGERRLVGSLQFDMLCT